jgi:hypothetical protein
MDANRLVEPTPEAEERVVEAELALGVGGELFGFLSPLLRELDAKLDLRLVRTLANTVLAIIRHRDRPLALLLSELGALLVGPAHAPAGIKRLANLIHSERWQASLIEDYLLEQGKLFVEQDARRCPEGRVLCIADGSVLEKPESEKAEGLSPVNSSKARRLSRPRPRLGKGYFRGKPGGPIVVPGFNWLAVLLSPWALREQRRGVTLGAWHWYAKPLPTPEPASEPKPETPSSSEPTEPTGAPSWPAPKPELTKPDTPTQAPIMPQIDEIPRQRTPEAVLALLMRVVAAWGKDRLLHVWDRGLSGATWLGYVLDQEWQFVVRWKKGNRLRPKHSPSIGDPSATAYRRDKDGVKAWKLTQGFGAWGTQIIANPRNPKQPISVSFAAREVCLLTRDDPLWLILVRLGKSTKRRRGQSEPWRLLTNVPLETKQQCWRVVQAYVARWQIEQSIRFDKFELGIESIRVRSWQARKKLLMLAALAYAYLLALLGDCQSTLVAAILRFCHRTGRQAKDAWRSLYRLRAALALLWNQHTPSLQGFP